MTDWLAAAPPPLKIGPLGWLRVAWRGLPLAILVYGGLAVLMFLRLVERLLCGQARPLSPRITQTVCRLALRLMRLPLVVRGRPITLPGAIVANHASWLDVLALNAVAPVYFVAKAEVSGWLGVGWLARATDTVFIARKRAEAKRQQDLFEARLRAGHRLLFFPEGTSTDALRVLPFKSTLFAAFFAPELVDAMHVQPVTLAYHAPPGQDARFYGWWGKMAFAGHFLAMLATRRQGRVEMMFHPPVAVADFADRKELARHCEAVIRSAHPHTKGAA